MVSHSPFACHWQNGFWDNEPVIAHFSSNKDENSDIRIPRNFLELHPAHVCVMCVVCMGEAQAVRQNKIFCLLFFWFS